MVLTLVLSYCLASFNYGGKKERYMALTCRCHLSNIIPDSIFCDSMEWGVTCFFLLFFLFFVCLLVCFFERMINTFFLNIKETKAYHYNTNERGKTLSYDGLRRLGLESVLELRFHYEVSLLIHVTLFYTRDALRLVNTI